MAAQQPVEKPSPVGTLNKTDYRSIAIHAALLAISAIITYLISLIDNGTFSKESITIMTVISVLLKVAQKELNIN